MDDEGGTDQIYFERTGQKQQSCFPVFCGREKRSEGEMRDSPETEQEEDEEEEEERGYIMS